jgi:hypothetical protein
MLLSGLGGVFNPAFTAARKRCAGLLVDEGYARWKGGDNRAAPQCLVEGPAKIPNQ